MANSYRVEFTEIKPGNNPERQCDLVYGTVYDVRAYIGKYSAAGRVDWAAGIIVTEYTESDSTGRVLPLYTRPEA